MYLKWILATAITAVVITGCGDGPADLLPEEPITIDMADYTVDSNTTKNYNIVDNGGGDFIETKTYNITQDVDGNKVIKNYYLGDIMGITIIKENKIKEIINPENPFYAKSEENRFAKIDDTVSSFDMEFSESTIVCKLKEKLDGIVFTEDATGVGTSGHSYSGDILKLECEHTSERSDMYDLYYKYLKKGKGLVAIVNHSCEYDGLKKDQNYDTCAEANKKYWHKFFNN